MTATELREREQRDRADLEAIKRECQDVHRRMDAALRRWQTSQAEARRAEFAESLQGVASGG